MLEIRCSLTTAMLSYTAHDMSIGRDVRIVAAGLSRLLTGRATIDGLKPTETAVLFALSQSSPQTNAQLTISIGSEKAHVSRAVSALLNKGFVKFEVSVRHKSQRLLYLSKTGSQVVEDISEAGVPSMMARLGSLEPVVRSALSTLARYFERSAPERPNDDSHYSLTACDIRDLAWLASPRGWLPGIHWDERRKLLMNLIDLAEHLEHTSVEDAQSWVVRNWGDRIGGCVLTPDIEDIENAWIKLLYLPARKEAGRLLLRQVISVAEERTFSILRHKSLNADISTHELLREQGFRPISVKELRSSNGPVEEMTWELTLRPSFVPPSQRR
jgi:DNA-binding MarR family transcriptional regulator